MPIPYKEAMADVQWRVKNAGTSFASGMRVLPRARREAMYALYAFCREVDDIADDSPTEEARRNGLALWRRRMSQLFENNAAEDTISTALLPAIIRYELIEKDFQAVIDGVEMDIQTICAPSMQVLDSYCDHVASAVGRISVRIFGDSSEKAQQVAHHLGRALQLTNILRDLAEDARRGRLYLPRELLVKHGLSDFTPAHVLRHPALPAICRDLATMAKAHFESSKILMAACDSKTMKPARMMRDYYHAIWRRLVKADWQDPSRRVSLPFYEKLWLALRSLVG